MQVLNRILNGIFHLLLVLPSGVFREAGLLLVSVAFGVGMVLLFRRFSNQDSIHRQKNAIKGHLLTLSLYPHELGLALPTYGKILTSLGKYLLLLLLPTLYLVVPFILVAVQVETRFGRLPLRSGEAVVVSALYDPDREGGLPGKIALEAPPGIEVETPLPVRIPGEGEVAWRVRPEVAGELTLRVTQGGEEYEKEIVVGEGVYALSVERPRGGVISQLLNPVESPLEDPEGPRAIRVEYRGGSVRLLFWETHWLVFFLVVSIAAAMVARVPLKVVM